MEYFDLQALYKQEPPGFGHPMKRFFALDSKYVNLNSGSYGSTPIPVHQAATEIGVQIEANPDHFLRLKYQPIMNGVREKLAKLIGAKRDECFLVSNASMGINTVLRNIHWEEGDKIIVFNTTYGSIARTAQYLSDIPPHPTVSNVTLAFPTTHAEIVTQFRKHLKALPKIENKRRVAVIDSIISNPGILLPWQELVKICKEEGVLSVIDGAHSIGQEVGINLTEAVPDFWVSNCHKWLYAKRSCAVLYIPERNQHIIESSIPTSHSYVSPQNRGELNLVDQFEWNGTIDFAPFLTVTAALDFRNWLGGEEKLNEYCHELALKGGKRLAEVMGTSVMDPEGSMTLNMVNVELPFPAHVGFSSEIDLSFKNKLLVQRNIYSAHFRHNGKWWTRCSAQIWNEVEDFEKLGKAWLEVCAEVVQELGLEGN